MSNNELADRGRFRKWGAGIATTFVLAGMLVQAGATPDATGGPLQRAAGMLRTTPHRFDALIEQHTQPRASVADIGKQDERVDLRLQGDVSGADEMRVRVSVAGIRDARPVIVERVAGKTYTVQPDGTRAPVEDPMAMTPGAHFAGYLEGAVNVRAREDALNARGITVFVFEIDGKKMAARAASQSGAPPRGSVAQVGGPVTLERLTGTGELWLRADGAPLRQSVSLDLPGDSATPDARVRMQVDYFGLAPTVTDLVTSAECPVCADVVNRAIGGLTLLVQTAWGHAGLLLIIAAMTLFALSLAAPGTPWSAVMRRAFVILLALNLALQAPLQVLAHDLVQVTRLPLRSLGEALVAAVNEDTTAAPSSKVGDSAPAVIDHHALSRQARSPAMLAASDEDVITKCGDGVTGADRDNDGVSDKAEGCIGLDAESDDTDEDGITDGVELTGTLVNGKRWPGDPFVPDANNDGLLDKFEYTVASGGVAPTSTFSSGADDFDGDGIPNVWDFDNDGDGVLDGNDLSPYAAGKVQDQIDLTLNRDNSGRVTYLEVQVIPSNTQHLRFANHVLDWPDGDAAGQMTDINNSFDDITLVPVLAIEADTVPTGTFASKYAVSTQTLASGASLLYVPLAPQAFGGAVQALYGKVAYPAGSSTISWKSVRLLWLVQAKADQLKPCERLACLGQVQTYNSSYSTILQSYPEAFRVSGLSVSASKDIDAQVFSTPNSPNEDVWLFKLMLGYHLGFMQHQSVTVSAAGSTLLGRYNTLLTSPNTPANLRFGVPSTVTTASRVRHTSHMDEAFAGIAEDVDALLRDNFPANATAGKRCIDLKNQPYECASVAVATESNFGSVSMNATQAAGASMAFEMGEITNQRKRTLKMTSYRRDGDGWKALELPLVFALIQQRYRDRLDELRASYGSFGARVSNQALFLPLYTVYATIMTGQISTFEIDAVKLRDTEAPPESEITGQIGVLVGGGASLASVANELHGLTYSSLLGVITTNFTQNGGRFTDGELFVFANQKRLQGYGAAKITLIVASAAVAIAKAVCAGQPDSAGCDKAGKEKIATAEITINSLSAATGVIDLVLLYKQSRVTVDVAGKVVTNVKATLDALKAPAWESASKLSKGLAIVGTLIGLTFTWVAFGLTWVGAQGNSVIKLNAIAIAIVTTVYLVFLFVLSFIPFGQIISAVLGILDAIIGVATGGEWSVARVITELFYTAKIMTELLGADYAGNQLGFIRGSRNIDGFVAGNTIQMSNEMSATMRVVNNGSSAFGLSDDGSDDDLARSSIRSEFVISSSSNGFITSTSAGTPVRMSYTSEDMPAVQFNQPFTATFTSKLPQRNVSATLMVRQILTYRWADCGLWAICAVKHDEVVITPDGELATSKSTFVLEWDILPDTLDGLWDWSELKNADLDSDGLDNTKEAVYGTSPNLWDTDGDGLSDSFEIENRATLGTNPLVKDSDGDGLDDFFEYQRGLNPGARDTDHDGIDDGVEVLRPTPGVLNALGREDGSYAIDWVGGWDVNVPGRGTARLFGNPWMADADLDALSDLQELGNRISPRAVNDAPVLRLRGMPWSADPNGPRSGVFVSPGAPVSFTVEVGSYGPVAITSTLTGCFPQTLAPISGGVMLALRPPALQLANCAGGPGFAHSFAASNTLQVTEEASATYRAAAAATSALGSVTFTLPYPPLVLSATMAIAVDVDAPEIAFIAPATGSALRGGSYVIGGIASDATSWVDRVTVLVNNVPLTTLLAINGSLDPFAVRWSLPADGLYTLQAIAQDHVGRSSSTNPHPVTVDNTPPSATLTITDPYVRPSGQPFSITLTGTASDNLAGVARIELSIDNAPFRAVSTPANPVFSQPFQHVWVIGADAEGSHSLRVRAFDRAGNVSAISSHTLIVDTLAPTSRLTTNRFELDVPDVPAVPITLTGFADDAGRAPLTVNAIDLAGTINPVMSATVWLQPALMGDVAQGVFPHWLGDINGDGRADLGLGFPAARGGAGAVVIMYGKTGGFNQEDLQGLRNLELLERSRAVLVGEPGAGIGSRLAPVGDVNCDGLNDLLIGDPLNGHATLVFGSGSSYGPNTPLTPRSGARVRFDAPEPSQFGARVAALGDINGDGSDDFVVGNDTRAFVLLGHCEVWAETQLAPAIASLVIDSTPGAAITGLGDLTGDQLDDYAVGIPNGVRVFEGSATLTRRSATPVNLSNGRMFESADALPSIAALGDATGDGRPDFVLSDGSAPRFVQGWGDGPITSRRFSMSPNITGLITAVGDVNADGRNDFVIGNAVGDAILIHGAANLATVSPAAAATFRGVRTVAPSPFAAGADMNCDASSDLVMVPSVPTSIDALQPRTPNVPGLPIQAIKAQLSSVRSLPQDPAANYIVDSVAAPGYTHLSIGAAIAAASPGQSIYIRPGQYPPFTVAKDNLSIFGAGADLVRVTGAGGSVVRIQNALGVQLSHMTLEGGTASLELINAGAGGSITASLRNTVEHVLMTGFSTQGVLMDRISSVVVQSNTLAGAASATQPWLNVTGAPDAALLPTWRTFTQTAIGNVGAGGSLQTFGDKVYVLPGNGSTSLVELNAGSLSYINTYFAPEGMRAGATSAMANDGTLYALNPGNWSSTSGSFGAGSTVMAMAVNNNGIVLALFGSVGQVGSTDLRQWNGSTWVQLVNAADGIMGNLIHALASHGADFLISGEFNALRLNATVLCASCQNMARYTPAGSVWSNAEGGPAHRALHISDGLQVIVDSGARVKVRPANSIGEQTTVGRLANGCGGLGDCDGSGVRVNAMTIITPWLYVGGMFESAYPGAGGTGVAIAVSNIARIHLLTHQTEAIGVGANAEVFALANGEGQVFAGGDFTSLGGLAASRVVRIFPGGGFGNMGTGANGTVRALATLGRELYVGGDFTSVDGVAANRVAHYSIHMVEWKALDSGTNGTVTKIVTEAGRTRMYAGGAFGTVNGATSPRLGIWDLPHVLRYPTPNGGAVWHRYPQNAPDEMLSPTSGATVDASGRPIFAYRDVGLGLLKMTPSGLTAFWSTFNINSALPGSATPHLEHVNGELYLLRGNTFYKRLDALNSSWVFTLAQAPLNFNADAGGGLAWDGADHLYATQGGGGQRAARYRISTNSWEELAATPGTINAGGGLERLGNALYQLRGNGTANIYTYGPVNVGLVKLIANNNLFVAPTGLPALSWLTPTVDLPEFQARANGNKTVGAATWTPALPNISEANAQLLDAAHGVYRIGISSTVSPAGYYLPVGDVYVSPLYCATCTNDGRTWGRSAFSSLQAAINVGAQRVRVLPGIYQEDIRLASGVQVVGSGADLSVISGTVRLQGVHGAQLSRFTLKGRYMAGDGVVSARLTRSIVRGGGVWLDGAAQVELINNTIVENDIGLLATGGAALDVRNTLFAYNATAGFEANSGSPVNERYNLFFANGVSGFADAIIDGQPRAANGNGNLQQEPRLVDRAAGDYRLGPRSPAAGAGNPGDPVPPGIGGNIDIGYAGQAYAAVFVDDDYCAQCANDGLIWEVDAFTSIPVALEVARSELAALKRGSALEAQGLRYLVGVGPGTYASGFQIPSHVSLVGAGPDKVTITSPIAPFADIVIQNAVGVEVRGLRINSWLGTLAFLIDGASSAITISHNVISNAYVGLWVTNRSSAVAEFNTVTDGYHAAWVPDAGAWLAMRNNIIDRQTIGLWPFDGRIYARNNLFSAVEFERINLATGRGDISVADAGFVDAAAGNFRLSPGSPAIDRATMDVLGPPGGGERADLGAFEARAAPVVLFLGKTGISCAAANSGVGAVDAALSGPLPNLLSPVSSTQPAILAPATLNTPLAAASYWTTVRAPAGDGFYRIYSRAADRLGNTESVSRDIFEGAFYVDSVAPVVSVITPATTLVSSEAAAIVFGEVAAFNGDRTASKVWFEWFQAGVTNTIPAAWEREAWQPGEARRFRASIPLPTGLGAASLVARAADAAGNIGTSAPRAASVSGQDGHAITFTGPDIGFASGGFVDVRGFARFNSSGPATVTVQDYIPALARAGVAANQIVTIQIAHAEARVPVPFVARVQLIGTGERFIYATADNANVLLGGSAVLPVIVDDSPPVLSTPPAQVVTRVVTLGGTASDAESGIARVDASFDGGVLWRAIPFFNGVWGVTETLPANVEGIHFPVRVRAVNGAGVASEVAVVIGVDDVPPRAFNNVTFNLAENSFFENGPELVVNWSPPEDGGGIARVGAIIDRNPGTEPANTMVGTTTNAVLNQAGAWYVHLIGVDVAGNSTIRHFGPWHVAGGTQLCVVNQTIQVDGNIQNARNEWRSDERLDDDVLAAPGTQQLWATWESGAMYLGWRGAVLPVMGTQWFYIRSAVGGTSQSVSNTLPVLPLVANHAIEVNGTGVARIWSYNGSQWAPGSGLTAVHRNGDTEARLAIPVSSATPLQLLAVLVDGGAVRAVFPTTNRSSLPILNSAYQWNAPCGGNAPALFQPQAEAVSLQLASREAPATPLGPNATIHYTLTLVNSEDHEVAGGNLTVSPGGNTIALGTLAPLTRSIVTFERVLPNVLVGQNAVTTSVQTRFGTLTRTQLVDGVIPTATVIPAPGNLIGLSARTVQGVAADVGSGVAEVYVRINGGPQVLAQGTALWSVPVVVSGALVTVSVQPRDRAGNIGPETVTVLGVDFQAPVVNFSLAQVITPGVARLSGSARDLPATGSIARVEVQINDETASWLPATFLQPSGETYAWSFDWQLPISDSLPHRVRARAVDGVGLRSLPIAWQQTTVDSVAPRITMTQPLLRQVIAPFTLSGMATDGGGIAKVEVIIYAPDGRAYEESAVLNGSSWSWSPKTPLIPGWYSLRMRAIDMAGNVTVLGAETRQMGSATQRIYLPQIGR